MSGELVLPTADFCRWCARPLTAAGAAKAPTDGFVAFVRAARSITG